MRDWIKLRNDFRSVCWGIALAASTAQAAKPPALPQDSLYQLPVHLVSQSGATVALDVERGHPTLVSMFYGSCPAACPMLITGIQVYEHRLDDVSRSRLRVLLVSFDAGRDTPDKLEGLAKLHGVDTTRWTLTAASESDARKLAALLGVHYRRNADGDFDHSLLITLLDAEGRVVASTSKIVGDETFLAHLRELTKSDVKTP